MQGPPFTALGGAKIDFEWLLLCALHNNTVSRCEPLQLYFALYSKLVHVRRICDSRPSFRFPFVCVRACLALGVYTAPRPNMGRAGARVACGRQPGKLRGLEELRVGAAGARRRDRVAAPLALQRLRGRRIGW